MDRFKKFLILMAIIFLLQFLLVAMFCGATDVSQMAQTTSQNNTLKIAVIEEPYEISVVINDYKLVKTISTSGDCQNYAGVIKEKVFGKDNPAVGDLRWCGVNQGSLVYKFSINKSFIIDTNSTLVQNSIPLAGKFAIKVLRTSKGAVDGVRILYVYKGKDDSFIGDHTPVVEYAKVVDYSANNSVYVIPTNSGGAIVVYKETVPEDKVVVKAGVKYRNNGYYYILGKPESVYVGDGLRVYYIFDKNCYKVYEVKGKNTVYVERTSDACNDQPAPTVFYADGPVKTIIQYETPKKVKIELITFATLLAVAVGFGIYINRNIEIKRG